MGRAGSRLHPLQRYCSKWMPIESDQVSDILKGKKGSIKQAQLPEESPSWEEFSEMTWEQIEKGAEEKIPGFKVVRKLLSDKRFDK